MNEVELKERTKRIALRVIKVIEALPPTKVADVIGRQLLRSGTSVGANYRAACRSKCQADMIAKLAIVEEEADESIYWLELLIESEILPAHRLLELMDDLNQIVAITVSSQKTLRGNNPESKIPNPKSKMKRWKTSSATNEPRNAWPSFRLDPQWSGYGPALPQGLSRKPEPGSDPAKPPLSGECPRKPFTASDPAKPPEHFVLNRFPDLTFPGMILARHLPDGPTQRPQIKSSRPGTGGWVPATEPRCAGDSGSRRNGREHRA